MPADLAVSFDFEPLKTNQKILKFLRLAPIIVGEHYHLLIRLKNLKPDLLKGVTLKYSISMRKANSGVQFDGQMSFGDLAGFDRVVGKSNVPYLMRDAPITEDLRIENAKSSDRKLTMMYEGKPNATFLDIYTVEPRSAITDRILNLLLVILAALSAYGVFRH